MVLNCEYLYKCCDIKLECILCKGIHLKSFILVVLLKQFENFQFTSLSKKKYALICKYFVSCHFVSCIR